MRILWNEIKKILTWKMLLLLAVVNSILFFLLIAFYIEYFPNGRPGLDNYNVSLEVLEKYGMEMDEGEFADFKETYATEVKKVDDYLQIRKEFIDIGLLSYEDLRNYNPDDEEVNALRWGCMRRKLEIPFGNYKRENTSLKSMRAMKLRSTVG